MRIIESIAEQEGIDVTELPESLASVINIEAVERLFNGGTGHVTFQFLDYEVTVDHSGYVETKPIISASN